MKASEMPPIDNGIVDDTVSIYKYSFSLAAPAPPPANLVFDNQFQMKMLLAEKHQAYYEFLLAFYQTKHPLFGYKFTL